MILQGNNWTIFAEEEIFIVEELESTSSVNQNISEISEKDTENWETKSIFKERNSGIKSKNVEKDTQTIEIINEELNLEDNFKHIQIQEDIEIEMEDVEINETNFPDKVFREYVKQFDVDNSGVLETNEIKNVIVIGVSSKGIVNLKGIEFFKSLGLLYCDENQLSNLDVSNNPLLKVLVCDENQLSSLDVSNNPLLTNLNCSENQLKSLDVSNNPELAILFCWKNQLKSLDVSNMLSLSELECQENQLNSLNVNNDSSLRKLYCWENQLSNLDVKSNPSLSLLYCNSNQLSNLDVSNNVNLIELDCYANKLSNLDLSNNPILTDLNCVSNQLINLNVSNNLDMTKLQCSDNQLSNLDVSNNRFLTLLRCENNQLSNLDISNNPSLTTLWCYNNQLTSLDVNNNPGLTDLSCSSNKFGSLDLSNNPSLDKLSCTNAFQVSTLTRVNGIWQIDLTDYVEINNLGRVTLDSKNVSLSDGMVFFNSSNPTRLTYKYDTKAPSLSESDRQMKVVLNFVAKECDIHDMITVIDQKATCGIPGSKHQECRICGYKEKTETVPATGKHSFGDYVIIKEATTKSEGVKAHTCIVCGKVEKTLIPKLTNQTEKVPMQTDQTIANLKVSGLTEGDRIISWKSSDEKIVQVTKKGILKAHKRLGTVIVTASFESGLTKKFEITVQKSKVKTTKISELPKMVTLKKEVKLTLKPVIIPFTSQDKVTYKSSNRKIAVVSKKGVIMGKKAGTAKITVISGKKKAVVKVKVEN